MTSFLTGLGQWFQSTFNTFLFWLYSLFQSFVFTVVDAFKDLFCWVFEQILTLVAFTLSALDVTSLPGFSGLVSGLPESLLSVMGLLGLGQAMSVIVAAIVIRLTLQLIPFVRWGS